MKIAANIAKILVGELAIKSFDKRKSEVRFPLINSCLSCEGTGSIPGIPVEDGFIMIECSECFGMGIIKTCPNCGAKDKFEESLLCPVCGSLINSRSIQD